MSLKLVRDDHRKGHFSDKTGTAGTQADGELEPCATEGEYHSFNWEIPENHKWRLEFGPQVFKSANKKPPKSQTKRQIQRFYFCTQRVESSHNPLVITVKSFSFFNFFRKCLYIDLKTPRKRKHRVFEPEPNSISNPINHRDGNDR